MPGDPIIYLLGEDVFAYGPEVIEEFREKFGLNRPLHEQFMIYLWNLFHGDLGYSFSYGAPISSLIMDHLPRTLMITLPAMVIASIIGCFLGAWCSWRLWENRKRTTSLLMLIFYSTPPYWTGMIFLLVFALHLRIIPPAPPIDANPLLQAIYILLLIATLLVYLIPFNAIIMKSLVTKFSEEAFVLTAVSKGLRSSRFIARHLIKPALPSYITLLAIEFAFAFSGSLFVEVIYSWPGMGLLMWNAVNARDYPLIQSVFTLTALVVIVANAIADFMIIYLDPRIKGE